MRTRILLALFAFAVSLSVLTQRALADPCGMVPPIYPGQEIPLARVGLQQTYVSYKDGVETFVIRPGFTGKVVQFGMLIPFPTPPAIRKVPDHIFGHIAAAVDPPEVVIDLRVQYWGRFSGKGSAKRRLEERRDNLSLTLKEKVKVLKQEAVGMYEVAVLEAGSAAALKRWMDDHGYKYPKGMDKPCDDYVDAGWCFVAIKTKVGQKDGVDPKPGQRTVDAKLPKGSTFDGHVQGMGFRFKSDELVVPMRLSAFNKGELRNVVYLLTDGPRKIRSIPEEYVVRQISGEQLYNNLTELLPLRIIGGTEADISESQRKELAQQRNPIPKNGAAGELFASDLLAIGSGRLALLHEEREKELLRIGERLGLRGSNIDKLNNQSLSEERRKTVEKSLSGLKDMTLTVVDGDFPREVLGKQNLTFAEYKMPSRRNRPAWYDAKINGPSPKKEGVLKLGALSPRQRDAVASNHDGSLRGSSTTWAVSLLIVAFVGLVISLRLNKLIRLTACFVLVSAVLLGGTLVADELSYYERTLTEKNIKANSAGLNEYLSGLHPNEQQRERAIQLIKALGTTDSFAKREDAMAKLLVLPVLPNEELIAASNGKDPEIRWRAKMILLLGKPESDRVLYAAFKTIEENAITGVSAELLRAIPLCDKTHLRCAARQALKSSARPSDAHLLMRELKNENVEVRIAVAAALGKALEEKASEELYRLLNDSEDRVKLAGARALVNLGDRKSLAALEKLLSSSDKLVQTSSALALRGLTGERFGFSAYDKAGKRKEAVAEWTAWIAGEGKTAELKFPLQPFGTGVSYLGGNTLLAYRNLNKVVEIDPSGKEVWSYASASNVWSAEKLANGNVLISDHSRQQVIEVDRKGTVVWQMKSSYPLNAKQLLNGNYLIAEWAGHRAIEVDPEKNVIWQYKTPGSCADVHRLENGNTLLGVYGRGVFEVTPDGKTVWDYPANNCYGCQPLPNGSVLIADIGGRVIEVSRDKQVAWEFAEQGAVDAFRLPNGNTLITGGSRFIEVTPDKNIVWTKTGTNYGTARR